MTLVVLGIDALDPELVDPESHPHLVLDHWHGMGTIESAQGGPSTHELWPTIITGLPPQEHGLLLSDGVAWGHPILNFGSKMARYLLPESLKSRIGDYLLNTVAIDTFRTPVQYYERHDLRTVFDDREARAIGIPNYVTDPNEQDREHQLRKNLGQLFERDPDAQGGHTSSDPGTFFELCLEMAMVRVARVRSALRSERYELVFGYTSGLDLIGHVSHDRPDLQRVAYVEFDDIVSDVVGDLSSTDELLIVSDHGLQDGIHTDEAMIAGTSERLVRGVDDVTDVFGAILDELEGGQHRPEHDHEDRFEWAGSDEVEQHLEDLGYL